MRPSSLRFAVCGLLLSVGVVTLLTPLAAQAAPVNFLIFIADDQGENDLGCYGNTRIGTPHVDTLAAQGMRFTHAYLSISSCSPSRSSILTGRWPHATYAEDLHDPLPADQWTIARYLKAANYHCVSVGKWHLGDDEKANWSSIATCQGEDTATFALKELADRPRGKPFFFWVASFDPHRPYKNDTPEPRHDPKRTLVPPYLPDHPLIRQELAQYYDEIARFDDHVGKIVTELDKQGVLDDTFIVYLSDNGMPFPRAKTTLYDSGIHTPLIVRFPRMMRGGAVQRGMVSSIDIAPTILEMAGVEQKTMQGRSMVPMLRDADTPGRDAVFAEANWHDFEQFTRTVRTERFKLIRNYYFDKPLWNSVDSINALTWKGMLEVKEQGNLTSAQAFLFRETRPFEELYDLSRDPYELKNVAGDARYASELERHRALLDQWRSETDDALPVKRKLDGWTRDGRPLPHNQPWYDQYLKAGGKSQFEKFGN